MLGILWPKKKPDYCTEVQSGLNFLSLNYAAHWLSPVFTGAADLGGLNGGKPGSLGSNVGFSLIDEALPN